jgi:PTS system cellobiose-specific IIB component
MTGRILVVCGSGASSTFLAQRLRALAEADGLATAVLLDADAARPEGARAALDRALAAMRQGARSLRLAPGLHGRPLGGSPPVA